MSYEAPRLRQMYTFDTFDFGGGSNGTFSIIPPKNLYGRLIDYGVYGTTEAFAAGTATPMMSVGIPSDADLYGDEFDMGAVAVNHGKSVLSTYDEHSTGAAALILAGGAIGANIAEIMVTCVAGTGSGLTGMAIPFVLIHWGA